MEKVYQITECSYEEYDHNNASYTIGIFTDKEVAENMLYRLNIDLESELNELYIKQDEFDNDEGKKYVDKNALYSPYSEEYLEIDYRIRELQKTSYYVQEYNINKLYK